MKIIVQLIMVSYVRQGLIYYLVYRQELRRSRRVTSIAEATSVPLIIIFMFAFNDCRRYETIWEFCEDKQNVFLEPGSLYIPSNFCALLFI